MRCRAGLRPEGRRESEPRQPLQKVVAAERLEDVVGGAQAVPVPLLLDDGHDHDRDVARQRIVFQ